jgi:hypothetical protein
VLLGCRFNPSARLVVDFDGRCRTAQPLLQFLNPRCEAIRSAGFFRLCVTVPRPCIANILEITLEAKAKIAFE